MRIFTNNKLSNLLVVSIIVIIIFILFGINVMLKGYFGIPYFNVDEYQIENMEISFDEEKWFDYEELEDISLYSKSDVAYIRGTMPVGSDDVSNPALYFETKNNFYKIYINNELKRDFTAGDNKFTGITWMIIPLENDYKYKEIYIEMEGNTIEETGVINDIYVGNSIYIYENVISSGLGMTVTMIVLMILGVALVSTRMSNIYRKYGLYHIGAFAFFYGAYMFTSVNYFSQLISTNLQFVAAISFVSLYLMLLCFLNYLLFNIDNKYYKRLGDRFNLAYLIAIGMFVVMEVLGIIDINYWRKYIIVLFLILNGMSLFLIYQDYKKCYLRKIKVDKLFYHMAILLAQLFVLIGLCADVIQSLEGEFYLNGTYLSKMLVAIFIFIVCAVLCDLIVEENGKFVKESELALINNEIVDLMIKEQEKLYAVTNYTELLKKFKENSISFLFPDFNDRTLRNHKISKLNYEKLLNDFLMFKNEASLFIYIQAPIENDELERKMVEATGRFEKYKDLDPNRMDEFIEFNDIKRMAVNDQNVYDDAIVIKIGNHNNNLVGGIIYYDKIGYLTKVQTQLLESFMITAGILVKNKALLQIAKNTEETIGYDLTRIMDTKSADKDNHIMRISEYSKLLGEKAGLSSDQLEILSMSSMLYDIGKVNLPDNILGKIDNLSPEEQIIFNTHTDIGYDLLKECRSTELKMAALIAKNHHENYDGSGINRLKGDEIDIYSRIVCIVAYFDNLYTEKSYKKALPIMDVINFFKEERGKKFDPELVDLLLENMEEFRYINEKLKDF